MSDTSFPNDNDPDRIIRGFFAWIAHPRQPSQRGTTDELDQAFDEVTDMAHDDPETLWPIIVRMVREAPDEHHLQTVGAAPLENLLWFHGAEFVDRIEAIARTDARFREALGQVMGWDDPISKPVADRLRPYVSGEQFPSGTE
jgi:hypothetical protein